MELRGKDLGMSEEACNDMKKVVSKTGIQMVCSEEDEQQLGGIHLPGGEGCENAKEVASKYGMTVVCDDEK